jgi:C-methyltransferase-like protein/putative zinc binding protein/methyltransferase family protein
MSGEPALTEAPKVIGRRAKSVTCRFCSTPLSRSFIDLGMSPLCETYLKPDELDCMEPFYPLHVFVCENCLLVQLMEYVSPENIFTEYAYFSSYSDSWLDHAKRYTEDMISRFDIGPHSEVIEIASNDGYLLQNFVARGISVLGIEPAVNVARVAAEKGIPSLVKFFGVQTARELISQGHHADLLVGNNVLAHVPDINDFVRGMKLLLAGDGVITMEFPHLQRMIEGNQYDTIYHEHFSYLSFLVVEKIFASHGLVLFDVESLRTHGGSLRIYARHAEDDSKPVAARVRELRAMELHNGYDRLETYSQFAPKVERTKRQLLDFLINAKREGKLVVGYGAPGKGNTLLNYCGIRTDFMDFTVDRNPYKQGKFTPGTHIPIAPPERIKASQPDYLFILPWNLKDEIIEQMKFIREWGGQFVVAIPEVRVYS